MEPEQTLWSGRYELVSLVPPTAPRISEIRLDVDGWFPQNVASGRISTSSTDCYFIASLNSGPSNSWQGSVQHVFGSPLIAVGDPIEIQCTNHTFVEMELRLKVVSTTLTAHAVHISKYFRDLDIEMDVYGDVAHLMHYDFDTCAHPWHPPSMTCETIGLQTIMRRAGFDTTVRVEDGLVPPPIWNPCATPPFTPIGLPTPGHTYNASDNAHRHYLMQHSWSAYSANPAWKVWLGFVHYTGKGAAGGMFDHFGPVHRQGAVIFPESIAYANPHAVNPDIPAHKRRFFIQVMAHEIGHALNLQHTSLKYIDPLMPHTPAPDEASIMTISSDFPGGDFFNGYEPFWRAFEMRFSDAELLYLRHGPEHLVMPGANPFGTAHGRSAPPKGIGLTAGLDEAKAKTTREPLVANHMTTWLRVEVTNQTEESFDAAKALSASALVGGQRQPLALSTFACGTVLSVPPDETRIVEMAVTIPDEVVEDAETVEFNLGEGNQTHVQLRGKGRR